MTDYVKSTNFTSKDSLAVGNPLKIVKGAEFDTEFNAIATAVATKADLASPALSGVPTAPTAATGTNTTQIATAAFVQTALQAVYPVGSLYLNATNATNPATLLGFGTWTAFGAGRMPVGFNAADPLFDTAEETGGSKDSVAVSHTHTASSTSTFTGTALPTHTHTTSVPVGTSGGGTASLANNDIAPGSYTSSAVSAGTPSGTVATTTTVDSSGVSGTNANLPPYITVYMWKRTA